MVIAQKQPEKGKNTEKREKGEAEKETDCFYEIDIIQITGEKAWI